MNTITDWFNGDKDYAKGVALYASLPICKNAVLTRFKKGYTSRNMSALVGLLRKYNTQPVLKKAKPIVLDVPKVSAPAIVNIEMKRAQIAHKSEQTEFIGIRIGDLPAQLRPRFVRARQVFYAMIELKFALNDISDKDHEAALKIIIQITTLDDERDLIWEELNHWKKHRKLLPVPKDEFVNLTAKELFRKKQNLKTSISKISKRVDIKYEELDKETNGHEKLLIEASIRNSEARLHAHKINMKKINELL